MSVGYCLKPADFPPLKVVETLSLEPVETGQLCSLLLRLHPYRYVPGSSPEAWQNQNFQEESQRNTDRHRTEFLPRLPKGGFITEKTNN